MKYRLLAGLVAAAALFGETRILKLSSTETIQDLLEIATVVRSITDTKELVVDKELKRIILNGTAEQVTAAEWIVAQLDQPVAGTGTLAYPNGGDDQIAVFTLPDLTSVQELNEAATAGRSIGMWRRLFVYNRLKAVVLRGTTNDVAMAGWIFAELDRPQGWPAKLEYRAAGGGDDLVRIFHLKAGMTVQELQEMVTATRSIGKLRQMFTFNARNVAMVRGTAADVAMAEWLLDELDGGARRAGMEYKVSPDDTVRLFYLKPEDSVQRVQEIAANIRTITSARRLFTYNPARAIVMRGTAEQMALAEKMLAH